MRRNKGKGTTWIIFAVACWFIFGRLGVTVTGIISFLLFFGISLAVIIAMARSAEKKGPGTQRGTVDTSASGKDNVNPYSSTYHQTAQSIRDGIGNQGKNAQAAPQGNDQQNYQYQYQSTYNNNQQYQSTYTRQDANTFNNTANNVVNNYNNADVKAQEEDITKRKRTGDKEIDKLLDEEEKAIREMKRLNDSILDEKVSSQIEHLEDVTQKIVDCIVEKPKKRNQVKKFFNYYLPTTLKLLNSYDRMDEVGISGENIDGTKGSIEALLDTALAAFDKELDALYSDEAIDVTSDIKVMESMLAQDGLMDDDIVKLLRK